MKQHPVLKRIMIAALLLIYLASCVQLGRWQFHRMEERRAWNHQVETNLQAAVSPAPQLLNQIDQSVQWRRVSYVGVFDLANQVLIRGRYFEGRYGYEVITPLRADQGPALLVDRGWVPAGESATTPPQVPAPPTGVVEVVGRVRLGDSDSRPGPSGAIIGLPTRAANQIKPSQLAKEIPYPVYNVYVEMTYPRLESPVGLAAPELSAGPHLAYAIQWFFFAFLGAVAPLIYRRIGQKSEASATLSR